MPIKDLHKEPFSEETLTKLNIFENYIKAWLPVFIMTPSAKEINIFDCFAGTGYDLNGKYGSPIRILSQILNQVGYIFSHKKKINVFLNEKDKNKFFQLKNACESFITNNLELKRCIDNDFLTITFSNSDFEEIFENYCNEMRKNKSLVFLDQNGIKFLSNKYLSKLENLKGVDFIYFVSSSYYLRFGKTEEFKKSISFNISNIRKVEYKYCHQQLVKELNSLIPNYNKTQLFPFTIKNKSNIYGIIFASKHPLGIEKFLTITWNENPINGLANFDIENDEFKNSQPNLFGTIEYTRIQKFQIDIKEKILSKQLKTNRDVYYYTLSSGFLPKHSAEVLKLLKKEKKVFYSEKSPYISYDKVFKENVLIEYNILGD